MTPMQRFMTRLVGRDTAAIMEQDSRAWKITCPSCGLERSVWEMGGIRYGAGGAKRTKGRCVRCGYLGWHEERRDENMPPAAKVSPWPLVGVVLLLVLSILAVVGALAFLSLWLLGVL